MGRDKALLPWGEGTLVAHAAARLAAVAAEVLVADAGRGYLPPPYLSVEDGPGAGPAAGLLGAARARPDHRLLVLACDLPQVPTALLERLLAAAQGADLTLPRTTRGLEPLCAVYGPRALEGLAERVAAGRFDLQGLAGEPGLEVRELRGEDLDAWLVNLNRPEDLPG
jgi:molybdenum cofactor guanylyltransferase